MELFSTSTLLAGGAMGLVAGCWSHIKAMMGHVTGLFVVTVVAKDTLAESMRNYCWRTMRRSSGCVRTYDSDFNFFKPDNCQRSIVYEKVSTTSTLCWLGWIPVLVKQTEPKGDVNSPVPPTPDIQLRFIRGTIDPDALALAANKLFRGKNVDYAHTTRFFIHFVYGSASDRPSRTPRGQHHHHAEADRPVGVSPDDIGAPVPKDGTEFLALAPPVEATVTDVKRWFSDRAWYAAHDVPWRRGMAFYGAPGNGKSTLARAMACQLGIPLYVFDLATLTNEELRDGWDSATNNSPCMVLIEDIDSVFDGRKNVAGSKLTFDALLNCIGGVGNNDGTLVVVTTNKVEGLDPALTRPGRLDVSLEFTPPDASGRRKIAQRILSDVPELVDEAVAKTEGCSGASTQEVITQLAIQHRTKP